VQQESAAVRVAVVDDEALMRAGLSMILASAPDIDVAAVCDGPEAVDTVERHRPDVVLLDVHMPRMSGLDVLPLLRALPDPPVVAMLTAYATGDFVHTALLEGAAGYLLKSSDSAQLIRSAPWPRDRARSPRPSHHSSSTATSPAGPSRPPGGQPPSHPGNARS
jgi:CheY-like chemotaxis protein